MFLTSVPGVRYFLTHSPTHGTMRKETWKKSISSQRHNHAFLPVEGVSVSGNVTLGYSLNNKNSLDLHFSLAKSVLVNASGL